MVTKKSAKLNRRAKLLGLFLGSDSKRKTGGLIYTVRAMCEREFKMGKLGPASPCKRINPETGEVVEIISPAKPQKQAAGKRKRFSGCGVARRGKLRSGTLSDAVERIMELEAAKSPLLRTVDSSSDISRK
jgi:hypothetical protein